MIEDILVLLIKLERLKYKGKVTILFAEDGVEIKTNPAIQEE